MDNTHPVADDIPQSLAKAVRLFAALDLFDMNGHISVRSDHGCWIHSAPVPRQLVKPCDIVEADWHGNVITGAGRAPNEVWIHLEIYRTRPDVQAITHYHGHWTNILSAAGIRPRPLTSVVSVLGTLPVYPHPESINSLERGHSVAQALGAHRALVLRAHGCIVTGSSLKEVLVASKYLEINSEQQVYAHSLSPTAGLSDKEIEDLGKSLWTPGNVEKAWDYFYASAVESGTLREVT